MVNERLASPTCTVVWFRRDLRLEDNPALIAAARAGTVVPVFIWSPEEEGQFYPGRVSRWWLKHSLIHLDGILRSLGVPLIFRYAKSCLPALLEIIRDTGATQIFYSHLYDPVSLVRDHKIKQSLSQNGITVQTFNADLLYEPWEVYDDNGLAFTTFNHFWNKCMNMPFEPDTPLMPPKHLLWPSGVSIPTLNPEQLGLENLHDRASNALLSRAWSPGCTHATKAHKAFLHGPLVDYAVNGCKTDSANTSLLSPHLHFGEISVRKIFHDVRRLQREWTAQNLPLGVAGVDSFLRSIGFREYSRYLSFNFPFTHERSLLANLKSFPWRIDEPAFKVWRQGRTGYPLVDAGMRELWATGWLHNRVRIVVSSFCVKFLQLSWRWGMKYFWDSLLDADLESDVLGWQYISGSLPDGHELDRMENPQVEGYKYDPEGEYVRRWIPELARLPTEWIHHPWDAPYHVLSAAGVELGVNYSFPIIDIASARENLQNALAEMWEREALLRSVQANGMEEGLGDTMEVEGTGGYNHRMRVHCSIVRKTEERRLSGEGREGSRRDQLVPSMPSATAELAAASILKKDNTSLYEDTAAVKSAMEKGIQPPLPPDAEGNSGEEGEAGESAPSTTCKVKEIREGKKSALRSEGGHHAAGYGSPLMDNRAGEMHRILFVKSKGYDSDDVDSTAESFAPIRPPHSSSHSHSLHESRQNEASTVPDWTHSTIAMSSDHSPPKSRLDRTDTGDSLGVVPNVSMEAEGRHRSGPRRLHHAMQIIDPLEAAGAESNENRSMKRQRRRSDMPWESIP